ncbi:MAG: ABC transporter ATP-binding protein [Eubacteriales bacterium]|nr:ABC transporter ATP-binding protein [Christensenellaceae bacterium]MDD7245937.1 ABC transporter ATP-binding protein [Christensenellaceae bacterium]MDY2750737.1 ABC transporter ATP-binding protein [Eubacteriales bacterium]MDY6079039.1 ABC transporter ATP-binding protein [Eubacteriales bacterium]
MKTPLKKRDKTKKTDYSSIVKLLKFAKPYLPLIIIALIFSLIQIAATLLVPVVIGRTIDYIVGENNVDFGVIFKNAGILGGLIAVVFLFQYLGSVAINKASFRTIRDLRRAAFDKLNNVPLSFIDGNSHGDLMSRVGSDIDQISDGLIQGFSQLFSGVVTILGTLAFMLYYNWAIALVVVILTPMSLFVAYFIAKGCHDMFAMQAKKRGELSGLVTEMLSNQKIVKLFGYETRAESRFDVINKDIKIYGQNAAFYSAMVNPSTRFVNNVVYVAVCMLGAYLVIRGNGILGSGVFTVGGLSCVLSYANQYAKPFNEITGVVTELQTATAAANRVFELLETPSQPSDEGLPDLENAEGNIEIDDVYFSYVKSRPLIEGFSLSVKSGQRIAIVGPTGCGKTTLINLLMRFYEPDSGTIKVENRNVTDFTRRSLRLNFGMVLQDTWLKKGTVRENIAYGKPDASDEEIIAAAKAAHIHNFIMRLENGYDTVLDDDGGNISQGQKQLLCIARVMLTHPPMLILDEATSSIDTRTELKIQQAFDKLMQNKTSFIVAHRLSTIKNADLILVMNNGNVIEKGTHKELIEKHGFYEKLYNSQFEH